jgi:hypothetical protein
MVVGVRLPWLSTFDHLVAQSGWGTRNGTVLIVLAGAAALLAVAQLVRPSSGLRWMLAISGFAAAGFAGYLLVQLYQAFQSFETMSFAHKEPGLYVALLGAALVLSTVFLPMPDEVSPARHPRSADTAGRGSWLRFPVAALATAAALAHVPVTPVHLAEARYIGVLFLALTVVLLLGATALLVGDSAITYAVLAASCALAVTAYVVSRTVGLPEIGDDVGHWFEPLGVVSVLGELGVVALAGVALRRGRRNGGSRRAVSAR